MKKPDSVGNVFRGVTAGVTIVVYVNSHESVFMHVPWHVLMLSVAGLAIIMDRIAQWILIILRKIWPLEPPDNDNPVC